MSSPNFYTGSYTPEYRFYQLQATNTKVIMWTPRSSARLVVTDIVVSTNAATSIRFSFSTSRGTIIGEFMCAASSVIYPFSGTVLDSLQPDLGLVIEGGSVPSNGGLTVTANGFEIEGT